MDLDSLQSQVPVYLTDPQKAKLAKELASYEDGNYFSEKPTELYLQGDIWEGFSIASTKTGEIKKIVGLTISNSCDISLENERYIPSKIAFCPIMKLQSLIDLLERSGKTNDQIQSIVQDIKKQNITTFFYIPSGGGLEEDYVANFNDIYNEPSRQFLENKNSKRISRFGQLGHYLLLFKISLHFCRFGENVYRD